MASSTRNDQSVLPRTDLIRQEWSSERSVEQQQDAVRGLLVLSKEQRPKENAETDSLQNTTTQQLPVGYGDLARDIARSTITPSSLRQYAGRTILWVDDHPHNNVNEIRLFESLGMQVDTSISTAAALEKLSRSKYDLVISDMRRGNNTQAGFELLNEMQSRHISIPFIIYSASSNKARQEEAARGGAKGDTNDPSELLKLVYANIPKVS